MEEYETSFYNFIFEEEDNKELKKNDLKELQNFISRNIRVWLFFHAISVYGCSNGFI